MTNLAKQKPFILGLVDQFKDFVSDAMDEGFHLDHEDHFDFLKAALDTFIEMEMED